VRGKGNEAKRGSKDGKAQQRQRARRRQREKDMQP
jgi:hypothetical protein